ncbi:MAG: SGNH/GDSL hydrolase family protein [Opitutaceae bacterium]|nr:SGNH/GDSL hydrolase family protein [Opitutaceae bacterium]
MINHPISLTCRVTALSAIVIAGTCLRSQPEDSTTQTWIATWGASPIKIHTVPPTVVQVGITGSVRFKIRATVGGEKIRINFSNELGEKSMTIGAATVALAESDGLVAPDSIKPLAFDGSAQVTIPAGGAKLSDPIALHLPAGAEAFVSVYFPSEAKLTPWLFAIVPHLADRDGTHLPVWLAARAIQVRSVVTRVDVLATRPALTIVALGDSITDNRSSFGGPTPWADHLAERLHAHGGPPCGLVNAGISGNRLLASGVGSSGLQRFDRDVVAVPGVKFLIIALGINDITFTDVPYLPGEPSKVKSADDLISAYQQLIARAHKKSIKIIGATITPSKDPQSEIPGTHTPQKEAIRQAVNRWIRTSGAFDGIVDFDAAIRDPSDPERMLPKFDPGDHVHPNDLGGWAMANVIDLSLFTTKAD